jgi:hypothetical protein
MTVDAVIGFVVGGIAGTTTIYVMGGPLFICGLTVMGLVAGAFLGMITLLIFTPVLSSSLPRVVSGATRSARQAVVASSAAHAPYVLLAGAYILMSPPSPYVPTDYWFRYLLLPAVILTSWIAFIVIGITTLDSAVNWYRSEGSPSSRPDAPPHVNYPSAST